MSWVYLAKTLELEFRLVAEQLAEVVDNLRRGGETLPLETGEVTRLRENSARLLRDARLLHEVTRKVLRTDLSTATDPAQPADWPERGAEIDEPYACWVEFNDLDDDGTTTTLTALADPRVELTRGVRVTVGDIEGNRARADVLGVDRTRGVVWLRVDVGTWTGRRTPG